VSAPDPNEAMREAVRNALREMLPDAIGQATTNGHPPTNGHGARGSEREPDVIPMVPAPPVAAVLRPSTWNGPAVPGEVIGGGSPAGPAPAQPAPAAPAAPEPTVTSRPPSAPARPAAGPPRPAPTARPTPAGATVETVTLDSDDDLQAFVRSLVTRLESPRDRLAIKAGRLQFRLRRSATSAGATASDTTPVTHVPRGAVTERQVRQAHSEGTRLVLARAAVLTPLARETARTLGVQIERETQC
jgi:hypothetical protein